MLLGEGGKFIVLKTWCRINKKWRILVMRSHGKLSQVTNILTFQLLKYIEGGGDYSKNNF